MKYYSTNPVNFFFYRNQQNELRYTLNGCHFPSKETLNQMLRIVAEVIDLGEDTREAIDVRITERQNREEKELMEENRINAKIRAPKKGFIYLIKSLNLYKIGRCENPNRIKTYRTENPHHIDLIFQVEVLDCVGIEKMLLEKYSSKKYKGEWFKLNAKDILDIRDILTY
jgi:hypothetical protein